MKTKVINEDLIIFFNEDSLPINQGYEWLLPQQYWVENEPIATFWDLWFSHSDASVSRKSHLVTISKAAVYPWECWSKFLVAGCPSSHQLGLGKRRWNLETYSAILELLPAYP